MNTSNKDNKGGRLNSVWAGLVVYALAGWAAVEIVFVIRERLDLPGILEPIVLGLFAAGFLATALLAGLRRRQNVTPVVHGLQLLTATIACAAVALGMATWLQAPGESTGEASIAVLPCDYDGDEEYDYLGNGLAEEVHARLSTLRDLRVPPWRSVLRIHAINPSPAFVAERLGVDNVAACRVERNGAKLNIEVQILRPGNNETLLQRRYESVSAKLPSVVAEVAGAFVDQTAPRLRTDALFEDLPTSDPEAYELYLRANALVDPASYGDRIPLFSDQLEQVEGLLNRAVALDPEFANAYGRLASLQWEFATFSPHDSADAGEALQERALNNVVKALTLDDCNVFGLYTAAYMRYDPWYAEHSDEFQDLIGRVGQETMARKAVECQPNEPYSWIMMFDLYSMYQAHKPQTVDQLFEIITNERRAIKKAAALDPVDCTIVGEYAGSVLLEFFRFARRSAAEQQAFEADPDAWRAQRAVENDQAVREALDSIQNLLAITPNCFYLYSRLAYYYPGESGRRFDKALAWTLKTIEADPEWAYMTEFAGSLYLEMGLLKQAETWARRAAERSYDGGRTLDEVQVVQGNTAPMLQRIQRALDEIADSTNAPVIKRTYGRAAGSAARAGEFERAAGLLEEGMAKLGISNPVEFLPFLRSSSNRRLLALYWALAYQRVGQDLNANALLEESRWRDPVFAEATDMYQRTTYADAYYAALSDDPGEALRLLRHSVETWQEGHGGISALSLLIRNPILDPIREHPEFGPQLEELVAEYDAVLAPMRENVLQADTAGNWEPLLGF